MNCCSPADFVWSHEGPVVKVTAKSEAESGACALAAEADTIHVVARANSNVRRTVMGGAPFRSMEIDSQMYGLR
jgi:hypothetical protein